MSFERICANIIESHFDKEIGRNQYRKPEHKQKAMLVSFRVKVDYDVEEGYRHLDLLIWGPMNYVAVMVRERWNVVRASDLVPHPDFEGDTCIREGSEGYVEGDTGWKLASYHDSCWRSDGVDNVIFGNRHRITGIDSLFKWYEEINPSPEQKQEFEKLLSRSGDYQDYHYDSRNPERDVFHFSTEVAVEE